MTETDKDRLAGKTAVITGGAAGMGSITAQISCEAADSAATNSSSKNRLFGKPVRSYAKTLRGAVG